MSDHTPLALEGYKGSISLGLGWLAKHQDADSTFGLPFEAGVGPIMVTPLTFLWGGCPWRSAGVIETFASRHIRNDGTLERPARETVMSDQFQHPYALSWVVRSAAACDRHDLAHRCATPIATFQHVASGGFFGTPEEMTKGSGVIDMASTGMASLAMIAVDHIDRTRAAGDYVLAWIDRQEEFPRCIFPQWHTDRGFIHDATENDHPPNGNVPLVISHDAAEADYWLCGILIAFLSELYMVTGESCYLDAALRVFRFSQASPELGNVCRSHKFAWGAARLYAVSHAIAVAWRQGAGLQSDSWRRSSPTATLFTWMSIVLRTSARMP